MVFVVYLQPLERGRARGPRGHFWRWPHITSYGSYGSYVLVILGLIKLEFHVHVRMYMFVVYVCIDLIRRMPRGELWSILTQTAAIPTSSCAQPQHHPSFMPPHSLHQGRVCHTQDMFVISGFPMISGWDPTNSSSRMTTRQAISRAANSGWDQLQTPQCGDFAKIIHKTFNHQWQKSSKRSVDISWYQLLCTILSMWPWYPMVQVFPWSQLPSISPSGTWPMWRSKTGARCFGPVEKHGGALSGCCKGSRSWETRFTVRCCEVLYCKQDPTWWIIMDHDGSWWQIIWILIHIMI